MSESEADPAAGAINLLRQRSYVSLWIARFTSSMGVQAQAVTIAWQIYALARLHSDVRHAALAVGMIGLAQFAPLFALTLVAGETADRYDRKIIGMICMSMEVLTAAALAFLAYRGLHALWPIYLIAVVFGASRAFQSPAMSALAPMLVPRPLLPRAIAWNSLAWQSASILGPALGGLLCAISPAAAYTASLGCS